MSRPNDPPSFLAVYPRRPLTAVVLLALAAAVGCSGPSPSATSTDSGTSAVTTADRSTPSTTSSSSGTSHVPDTAAGRTGSTPPTFAAEQQAVIDAYAQANNAYEQAAASSNPTDPAFIAAYAPQYRHELQIQIQQRTDNGQAVRDAQPSKARISYVAVHVTPLSASLITCEVDDRVVYRVADGSAVNTSVETDRWSSSMTSDGGTWKLEGRHQVKTWDGEEMDACLSVPQS